MSSEMKKLTCLIWLLIYFSKSKAFESNSCILELTKAYCTDELKIEDLKLLHQTLPNSIQELIISFQNMATFQTCSFKSFSNLTLLSLSYNQMTDLPKNMSTCLPSVKQLYLNNNKFSTISNESLLSYKNIEVLRLHRNEFHEIPAYTFQAAKQLQELWLNENNLTNIQSNAFYGLDKLETLNLANCRLKEIRDNIFSKLKSLRSLNLENNDINFVEKRAFQNLSMQYIDLHSNSITKLYGETFLNSRLLQINLANNPINCSCDAFSAFRVSSNILGKCSTPLSLKNKELNVVVRDLDICNSNKSCHKTINNTCLKTDVAFINHENNWSVLWVAIAVCPVILATVAYCCYQRKISVRQQRVVVFQNFSFGNIGNRLLDD